MIRTTITDIKRYFCLGRGIRLAVDFIKNNDLISLPPGRYPIEGARVFALIQEVRTMLPADAPFENHLCSADLQMTLSGEECVGYCPVSKLTKFGSYNATADTQNYTGQADCIMQNQANDSVSIFFPEDGHQPYVAKDTPMHIKKVVIRINMDYINIYELR
ncbi:MAG: YhcH/YjgK/YiaL family protein [bacterium]|nr:YhcH/YjgK/YiaL family protein [bacterium]